MPFLRKSPDAEYLQAISQLATGSRELGDAQRDRRVSGSKYYPRRDVRAALARTAIRLAKKAHVPDETRVTDIQRAYQEENIYVQQYNS